jgi:hypothetical protein
MLAGVFVDVDMRRFSLRCLSDPAANLDGSYFALCCLAGLAAACSSRVTPCQKPAALPAISYRQVLSGSDFQAGHEGACSSAAPSADKDVLVM